MRKYFWLLLAQLGFWIPCKKFMPPRGVYDWVMISLYEKGLDYRYIPKIAECSPVTKKWHTQDEVDEDFLNQHCNITHWRRIPNDRRIPIR